MKKLFLIFTLFNLLSPSILILTKDGEEIDDDVTDLISRTFYDNDIVTKSSTDGLAKTFDRVILSPQRYDRPCYNELVITYKSEVEPALSEKKKAYFHGVKVCQDYCCCFSNVTLRLDNIGLFLSTSSEKKRVTFSPDAKVYPADSEFISIEADPGV